MTLIVVLILAVGALVAWFIARAAHRWPKAGGHAHKSFFNR